MRPQKMRKATPTQNSALASMWISRSGVDVVEGGLDALRSRSPAGQAFDDGAGRVARDAAHVAHGLGLAGRDGRLGFGQAGIEVGLEGLALGVALRRQLGAGLLGEGLGAALGLGEGLVVGGSRLFGA